MAVQDAIDPSLERVLGRKVKLVVDRLGARGAFLVISDDAPMAFLARDEVPEGCEVGHTVEVFVYLDGDRRPIGTTRPVKLTLGEVAFLRVTDLAPFGAFVDWGLPKELLVPTGEETRELYVGDRHPFALFIDDTGRLAATMRIAERLRSPSRLAVGAWVEGEAWRIDDGIGLFVIIERRWVGLLPVDEPHRLGRGDVGRFRVSRVHFDGKIELSLRAPAHEELEGDARRIKEVLALPATPRVGDRSPPELVRSLFGLSKKAFKRAAGRLMKDGAAHEDPDGYLVLGPRDATRVIRRGGDERS